MSITAIVRNVRQLMVWSISAHIKAIIAALLQKQNTRHFEHINESNQKGLLLHALPRVRRGHLESRWLRPYGLLEMSLRVLLDLPGTLPQLQSYRRNEKLPSTEKTDKKSATTAPVYVSGRENDARKQPSLQLQEHITRVWRSSRGPVNFYFVPHSGDVHCVVVDSHSGTGTRDCLDLDRLRNQTGLKECLFVTKPKACLYRNVQRNGILFNPEGQV